MATYAFPTLADRSIAQLEFGLRSNVQIFTSELSGEVQTLELPGARWTMSFRVAALARASDAAKLEAFLAKLRGGANRARMPVFGRSAPRGTWAGAPAVNNEVGSPTLSQTGNTLQVNGFSASASFEEGDYFNLGANGQLLMITASGQANGSGLATLSVEPAIRVAPAHGTLLVFNDPVVPLMIPSDAHARWNIKAGDINDFAFDLVEVFA